MGTGGGIISRKLLFAVFLVASLSLIGIASVSAADIETDQKTTSNTNTLNKNINTPLKSENSYKNSAITQNKADESTKIVQKATNNEDNSTQLRNSNKITKTKTKKTRTIKKNHNSIKYHKKIQNSTNNSVTKQTITTVPKTVTQQSNENSVSSGNSVTESTNTVSKTVNPQVSCNTSVIESTTVPKTVTSQVPDNNSITESKTQKTSTSTILDTTQLDSTKNLSENSNESQMTDYLEQFDENDAALIGTNVTNDEPIAAGGTTSLQSYLVQTAYCDVNSQTIRATAAAITAGKTSTYAKAVAIFNYVRDRTSYSFYYNTKKGALGTLTSRSANCCDHTHLLIALLRASGIPAKYVYVKAQFTSGSWYGHVYANVWVDGRWYSADATSNSNTFGVIRNWNLSTCTLKGIYASLPF